MKVVDPFAGRKHQTYMVGTVNKCCDTYCAEKLKCVKGFDIMSDEEINAALK